MKHVGKRVKVVKNDVFIHAFVERRDYTVTLTEIENILFPSSSKTIVSRAAAKAKAVNSAKNSHLFFMGLWNVFPEEKAYKQDSVDLTATLSLQKQKH